MRGLFTVAAFLLFASPPFILPAAETSRIYLSAEESSSGQSGEITSRAVSEAYLSSLKAVRELKKIEEDASAAKKKELSEISRKRIELDELDKQISLMKSRLAAKAARSYDSLDAVKAMTDYKAEQGKQLTELLQFHEVQEQKRQQQVEVFRRETRKAEENWAAEVYADFDRYQQVATNKYQRNMKDAAWDALITAYPAAKEVKRHDAGSFFSKLGINHHSRADQSCHTDLKTGFMWVNNSNFIGKAMNWQDAVKWASALNYGGYSDWRLPTKEELLMFAKQGANSMAAYLKTGIRNGLYWTSTIHDNDPDNVWAVNINDGSISNFSKSSSNHVWPIRSISTK